MYICISTYDGLIGCRRTRSTSDRLQSSRIITNINVEGELKGNHFGERASFDPRPEVPAFERPSFPLSVNPSLSAYRSEIETSAEFFGVAIEPGRLAFARRAQQSGVVISVGKIVLRFLLPARGAYYRSQAAEKKRAGNDISS